MVLGEDWRARIRRAITDNALVFIACFSQVSLGRVKSYQNEELILAMGQLRMRRPEDPWLIPVRFDQCAIPDRDIGDGRTLRSIQWADLFGDRAEENTTRLTAAVLRILTRPAPPEGDPAETPSLTPFSRLLAHKSKTAAQTDVLGSHQPSEERGPLFYVSYAPPESGQWSATPTTSLWQVEQFYDELSKSVADLARLPDRQSAGYMQRSFAAGGSWPQELLDGLGTCQVFVPLLSTPYFSSVVCGTEWFAFSQRRVVSRAGGRPGAQSPIIPVLWSPVGAADVPAAVRSLQQFLPQDLPGQNRRGVYAENGLAGLLEMSMEAEYHDVIRQLALRIVQLAENVYVEPRPINRDQLRNIFWSAGP